MAVCLLLSLYIYLGLHWATICLREALVCKGSTIQCSSSEWRKEVERVAVKLASLRRRSPSMEALLSASGGTGMSEEKDRKLKDTCPPPVSLALHDSASLDTKRTVRHKCSSWQSKLADERQGVRDWELVDCNCRTAPWWWGCRRVEKGDTDYQSTKVWRLFGAYHFPIRVLCKQ